MPIKNISNFRYAQRHTHRKRERECDFIVMKIHYLIIFSSKCHTGLATYVLISPQSQFNFIPLNYNIKYRNISQSNVLIISISQFILCTIKVNLMYYGMRKIAISVKA